MQRTIRVTGKGKLSVKPDTIRLIITQTHLEDNYEKAVSQSAEMKGFLNAGLEKTGFKKSDLKTLYFNVGTEYEGYQAEDKSWKNRLMGYRYTHRMKLEFPADNEVLGDVLMVVAHCPGEPEFTIQYTIADPEAAKNELLAKAVEDSKIKAEVLSKAAGVVLKDIISIDYSWGELDFVSTPMNGMMLPACEMVSTDCKRSISMDIDADDIEVTDTVTVMWEIG